MERAIYYALNDGSTKLLQKELIQYVDIEDLIQPDISSNLFIRLVFDGRSGFSLDLTNNDGPHTIAVPKNLLREIYEMEAIEAYQDNHFEDYCEEASTNSEEMASLQDLQQFEAHAEDGCPVCKESHLRLMQDMYSQLVDEMSFYASELCDFAEEILGEPNTYVADFVVTISHDVGTKKGCVKLDFDSLYLGILDQLDYVQFMLENRITACKSLLPKVLVYNSTTSGNKISLPALYPILIHTPLTKEKLELYIAHKIDESVTLAELYNYTSSDHMVPEDTVQKFLDEVNDILQDFTKIIQGG